MEKFGRNLKSAGEKVPNEVKFDMAQDRKEIERMIPNRSRKN